MLADRKPRPTTIPTDCLKNDGRTRLEPGNVNQECLLSYYDIDINNATLFKVMRLGSVDRLTLFQVHAGKFRRLCL